MLITFVRKVPQRSGATQNDHKSNSYQQREKLKADSFFLEKLGPKIGGHPKKQNMLQAIYGTMRG